MAKRATALLGPVGKRRRLGLCMANYHAAARDPGDISYPAVRDTAPTVPPKPPMPSDTAKYNPGSVLPPPVKPPRPVVKSDQALKHLRAFNKKYHGMADFDTKQAAFGESFYHALSSSHDIPAVETSWRSTIPTRLQLFRNRFGRPDLSHSFHQTPCLETCSIHVLRSGFLTPDSLLAWSEADPLILHLAASSVAFSVYDFRWVREYNPDWSKQMAIDPDRQIAYTAILLHYHLDVSLLMRYLGNNFTGEYHPTPHGARDPC